MRLSLALYLTTLASASPAPASATPACQAPAVPSPEQVQKVLETQDGRYADQVSHGPRVGQQALRDRLPVMPGALGPLVDISDGVETYGVPMNLASFETEKPASAVLDYYAHYFQQRGWDLVGPAETSKAVPYPAVSATSGPEGLQLSVMVMGRSPKGSTVILGLANMKAVMEKQARPWKKPELGDLPLYPGSDPMALTSLDQEMRGRTVTFETHDPVEKVATFYRHEMGALGYQEQAIDMPTDGRVTHLQFLKSGHAWTIALSPAGPRAVITAMGREEANP